MYSQTHKFKRKANNTCPNPLRQNRSLAAAVYLSARGLAEMASLHRPLRRNPYLDIMAVALAIYRRADFLMEENGLK